MSSNRPLAVITGASSGIGKALARICAEHGFDLVVAADEPSINDVASTLERLGVSVHPVQADLATIAGVDRLYAAAGGRPIDALLANAGHGLGKGFLDQEFDDVRHVIDTNVTGTVYLIQRVARDMRARGRGRILITGSVAGYMPGTFQAVYNGTKAFIDSFSLALRAELKGSGVTVTCLMPGPTETAFFDRADMTDTRVGQSKKDDPADVARAGFDAMLRGEGDVVTGWKNKVQSTIANVTPSGIAAEMHRRMAEPGYTSRTNGHDRQALDGRERMVWKGIVAGLAGGLAASWAMNQFQQQLAAIAPQPSGGDDATMKAASAISETVADRPLTKPEKETAGPAVHYAFGSTIGAVYGGVGEMMPLATRGWGLPFGAALWLGADEIAVPGLGLAPKPSESALSSHAYAFASHMVYGLTADAVRRLVRATL